MRLRFSEWIAVGYFIYLAGIAIRRLRDRRSHRVLGTSAAVVATIVGVAQLDGTAGVAVLRDWLPLVYLVLGYWLPAALVTTTNEAAERRLLALDHEWLGRGLTSLATWSPPVLLDLLELMYILYYPVIPAGLAWLYLAGLRGEADRFWTAVLVADLPCYGVLPWLSTRPPRVLEPGPPRQLGLIRRLNLRVLDRASIGLNTFPSGHVAASMATALAVGAGLPTAGWVLGLIAVGVSIGSVAGRYHYAADAVAGALMALAGFSVSRLL